MADWSLLDREWLPAPPPPAPYDSYQYANYDLYYQEKPQPLPLPMQQQQAYYSPSPQTLTLLLASPRHRPPPGPMPAPVPMTVPVPYMPPIPKGDNPRQIRNKMEKQRRDKLNQSIAELASMVPPVVAASRKVDKTGVLRLTAHYLRAHQHVFGDSIGHTSQFTASSAMALLGLLNGFLLTTTYKGLVVVVSQNVNEYLGYSELDLLGQNIFNMTHEDDRQMLRDQLMPRTQKLGKNGELLIPDEGDGKQRVATELANEKRRFIVRFKKLGQRSEPSKYVTCHVEGSLRKSDRACHSYNRSCQIVRRARARGDNPCASGNDIVFIGVVRPTTETFISESAMESYKMEYRTRHSIDGEIIQCEQRIALVTGYMLDEVYGVNAMNFIHRDEVHWVVVALREMYKNGVLFGESCYRLMTKNGQFIYMSTRGCLDVDEGARAATSFVCTNTVVDEAQGKQLIKMMKDRFTLSDNTNNTGVLPIEDNKDMSDNMAVAVEDPRQLQKVIMHLVTDLPSLNDMPSSSQLSPRFAIIPPKKERILSAINKIYTVIKAIPKPPGSIMMPKAAATEDYKLANLPPLPLDDSYLAVRDSLAVGPVTSNCQFPNILGNTMPCNYGMMSTEESHFQYSPLTEFQDEMMSVPGTSADGARRTFDQENQETLNQNKVVAYELDAAQQIPERNSPGIEMFFDKAALNHQIESAIDSLEYGLDPSFPDLLTSNDIQEILENIEAQGEAKDEAQDKAQDEAQDEAQD